MNLFECKCNGCNARFITALNDENEKSECPACNSDDLVKKSIDSEEFGCGDGCSSCGGCH